MDKAESESAPSAQDIIDALRFVRMAQKEPRELARVMNALLDLAPLTDTDRGLKLIVDLICEGSLKVALVDA